MRIRFFLVCASAAFVFSGLAIQACGGTAESTPSTDTTPTSQIDAAGGGGGDSSIAPSDSGRKDVAVDASEPEECDTNANLLSGIADASIADGASTTGACAGCVQANCPAQLTKCSSDCTCQSIAAEAIECFARTQDLQMCASAANGASTKTLQLFLPLGICVQNSCLAACGLPSADAGM